MATENVSVKHIEIDKANSRMVAIVAMAAFVVVFSLVVSRALLGQRSYQARVIAGKQKAVKQLKDNITSVDSLVKSYSVFVSSSTNVLGGNSTGTGAQDGDNAKLVLDALPSQYDFPALATSLEKILTSKNYKINSITGTDDEINQQNTAKPNPEPVDMPFQISINGTYASMQDLINTLERSIRPFQLQSIEFTGDDQDIRALISAKTFYQPEKSLKITTEVVK